MPGRQLRSHLALAGLVALALWSACSGGAGRPAYPDAGRDGEAGPLDGADDAEPGEGAADAGGLPLFRVCEAAEPPMGLPAEGFDNLGSDIIAPTGAGHSAQDVIAAAGGPVTIVGKFAYGPLSTDLQAERVEVWLDDCSGQYVLEGEAITNGDGRIALELGGEALPVGRYATFLRVAGDSSSVRSTLFVVPPGTRAAVFDIDGTLTSDDLELVTDVLADLFAPILSGDYVPAARPAAGAITGLRDEQGYLLLYLTGRPYWLTGRSREWLAAEGMPVGAVHLADGNGETLPTNAAVGAYKAEYLESLASLGLEVVMAYGNATTDIYAYAQAGIPVDRTYVLGTNGGQGGTVALGESYEEHLAAAMAEPDASQPFRRE